MRQAHLPRTGPQSMSIGGETQGLATVQCEYNNLIVGATSVKPDVMITHNMGLGTAGLEHGVATDCNAITNLLLGTPRQQLDDICDHTTITHNKCG